MNIEVNEKFEEKTELWELAQWMPSQTMPNISINNVPMNYIMAIFTNKPLLH